MNQAQALRVLRALADESRLDVFKCLLRQGPIGLRTADISNQTQIAPPMLGRHLAELEDAGLAVSWAGRDYHSLNLEGLRRLVVFLTEDCCDGNRELCRSLRLAAQWQEPEPVQLRSAAG
jgi:ArsR family transcriptional regulator, arsenate/arsenite/antimonite-responsive transcriptional repressor